MKRLILSLLLLSSGASAQDALTYVKAHASIVGGFVDADGSREKIVELRISDDFALAPRWRAAVRVSLFSATRGKADVTIPTTLAEVQAYSDGEAWLSVYREIRPGLAVECLGGLMVKMPSITGQDGDPLDGTKLALGCGPRLSRDGFTITAAVGHFGPVVDGDKLAGPIPSLLVHARIPLKFLGDSTTLVPDLAFGARPPALGDPDQRRTITRTLRIGVETRF